MSQSPVSVELSYELSEEAKKAFRKLRHDIVNDLSIVIMSLDLRKEDLTDEQRANLKKRCHAAISKLNDYIK